MPSITGGSRASEGGSDGEEVDFGSDPASGRIAALPEGQGGQADPGQETGGRGEEIRGDRAPRAAGADPAEDFAAEMTNLHIYAQRVDFGLRIALYIYRRGSAGVDAVAEPLTLRTITNQEVGMSHQPTLQLNPTQAQELIDTLWDCGVRPTEGSGSAGALAATQRHLEDMRVLVFQQIGAEKPK